MNFQNLRVETSQENWQTDKLSIDKEYSTHLNNLKKLIKEEFDKLQKVSEGYRPTKGQYEKLLFALEIIFSKYEGKQKTIEKLSEEVGGLKHQIHKLRDNIDKSITGSKVRFRIGKLVILK